jgi:hypothetical protein
VPALWPLAATWAWGDGFADVLELNHGLMIPLDMTVDEPSRLGATERVATFSRLIRFDAGGLGLLGPPPGGGAPSTERWAGDALAGLDPAGGDRAVVLSKTRGSGRHTETSVPRRATWSLHVVAGRGPRVSAP